MTHCNDCQDILHNSSTPLSKPDVWILIISQLILFVVVCFFYEINVSMMKNFLMAALIVLVIGFVLSQMNKCKIRERTWHIVMGRFMVTLLIFLFIYKTNVPVFLKLIAFIIMCSVGFIEINSMRHYTSDLILTVVLTYLAIGLFDSTKLGYSASVMSGVAFYITMTIVLVFLGSDIICNKNNEVSQRHENIRNIFFELFTQLNIAALILCLAYLLQLKGANVATSKVIICSIVYFLCCLYVTFFYFSIFTNVNVAIFSIAMMIVFFMIVCKKCGLSNFQTGKTTIM